MNLYRFISNDITPGIYSYNAIKYQNGNKYATNGHIMVKIKEDYPATQEGKLLDKKGNEYIMVRPINFDAILPSDLSGWQLMSEFEKLTLSNLVAVIKAKEITPRVAFIVIGGCAFRYSHFRLFLSVLKEYKSQVYHRNTHLYTRCDGMDCILMAAAPASAINPEYTIDINQFKN